MDELDRKILYSIAENARESHNKIARSLRCSREVLDYRIKKLESEGVITGYQARLNISNFIYAGYILLVQVSGINKEVEKKVIEKLKNSSKTQYIGKIGSDYDYIISFTVKNLNETEEYLSLVRNVFGNYRSKIVVLTMLREFKDSFKSIFSKENEKNDLVSMPNILKKQEVDWIDKKILVELGNDCSMPSWKVSEKVKLTEVGTRKRMEKLFRNQLILGYRTMIDLTKINKEIYFILLKTNFHNDDKEKEFISSLSNNNKITYNMKTLGEYDYILTLLVNDNRELKNYISEIRDKFFGSINEVYALPLFDMIYHTQLAENFLTN
jgi:Lrp/AsnC family leucine-responsive transcriptional regulator